MKFPQLVILGPTASGKSDVGMAVATLRDDAEIVAVDAMQVYRGMDIGTAKPTAHDQAMVRHHCIDLVEPSDAFTVAEFQTAARISLGEIAERKHRAVLVAGTGLYLTAVIDNLTLPGEWPLVRAELEREPDAVLLFDRLVTFLQNATGVVEATGAGT